MFLNIKSQRLCKSHHLQCIKSSKDSEKLEKSLCARDKDKDLCWILMVFRPSDDTASLISMILSLTLLNGPRNTSRNHCRENPIHCAICRCQLKLYHAKRKPYVNMVQKRRRVLWAKAHLKWTVSKWKSVLWSDKYKSDILVGNHGRHVLRDEEEGDLPACYQHSVQKPASLRWPRTRQQLETYLRQEWDQIPPKLQKLITSMPRRLHTVLKRRGDATPW